MRALVAKVAGMVVLLSAVSCGATRGALAGGSAAGACPRDAVPEGHGCACRRGLTVLDGACVGPREVAGFCGTAADGAAWATCKRRTCARGEAIDLERAECVPSRAVESLTAEEHPLASDMILGCHEGAALVIQGFHVACVPPAETCPRGTEWDATKGTCALVPPCGPGTVRAGGCVSVVTRAAQGGDAIVDVGGWTRAVVGPDGGDGTAQLCGALRRRPWDFEVSPGGARTVALSVELLFPDNDVTQLQARIQPTDASTGAPIRGEAPGTADRALESLLVALRALGGTTDAASAAMTVKCTIRGGSSPLALPR